MTPASAFVCLALVFALPRGRGRRWPGRHACGCSLWFRRISSRDEGRVACCIRPCRAKPCSRSTPYEGGESGYDDAENARRNLRCIPRAARPPRSLPRWRPARTASTRAARSGYVGVCGEQAEQPLLQSRPEMHGESHNFTPFLDSEPGREGRGAVEGGRLGWSS